MRERGNVYEGARGRWREMSQRRLLMFRYNNTVILAYVGRFLWRNTGGV